MADHVHVPIRHGVEGAGVEGRAGHGRGLVGRGASGKAYDGRGRATSPGRPTLGDASWFRPGRPPPHPPRRGPCRRPRPEPAEPGGAGGLRGPPCRRGAGRRHRDPATRGRPREPRRPGWERPHPPPRRRLPWAPRGGAGSPGRRGRSRSAGRATLRRRDDRGRARRPGDGACAPRRGCQRQAGDKPLRRHGADRRRPSRPRRRGPRIDPRQHALDHVNNLGWTALMEAVVLGDGGPRHLSTVRALVEAGASPADRRLGRASTPLRYARSPRSTPAVECDPAARRAPATGLTPAGVTAKARSRRRSAIAPEAAAQKLPAGGLHEPGPAEPRGDRPAGIHDGRRQHRDDAHHRELEAAGGRAGSTNCGRKAVKKARLFGFESATRNPRPTCEPAGRRRRLPRPPALRQAWTPSQIR